MDDSTQICKFQPTQPLPPQIQMDQHNLNKALVELEVLAVELEALVVEIEALVVVVFVLVAVAVVGLFTLTLQTVPKLLMPNNQKMKILYNLQI
ncbi:hypothetical protein PCASD_00126 [Puccinia coronata f. sp. avenae]|uniref:Uncharacterized protein n=1 Tax=Puccinia coronata f. sp. avenae TaxID=200324 RepID=A0A2N5VR26_9BASI|nr:hypothetical protein PCASD_00126 [Puccinia coronata f. sp. avenae]